MRVRHTTKGRRALSSAALLAGLALSVAGCGGEGDDGQDAAPSQSAPSPDEKGDDQQPTKPSSGSDGNTGPVAEAKDGDITVTIASAVRSAGGFVTVSGTVRNDGSDSWLGENWRSDERELRGNGGSLAGAALVDETAKKKYLILRDTSGRCLCTKFNGQIRSGETESWYAQFPAPPEGTNKVTFQVGSMPPASIEITGGE